jgi:hypothetical protein
VGREQRLEAPTKIDVADTRAIEKRCASVSVAFERSVEQRFQSLPLVRC